MNPDQITKKMHTILEVVGYSTEDQYKRVTDFINIGKLTFLEQVLGTLDKAKQKELEEFAKESKDIQKIIEKLSVLLEKDHEYFVKLYSEVLNSLFKDYLDTVYPVCTEIQRKQIDDILVSV
ncbi:hypothetical protein JW962_00905 [Candidatus Dojkabacteria bacterium]|nr:hypothetical protein [Candidatus Dojkabacteria bacterium]